MNIASASLTISDRLNYYSENAEILVGFGGSDLICNSRLRLKSSILIFQINF